MSFLLISPQVMLVCTSISQHQHVCCMWTIGFSCPFVSQTCHSPQEWTALNFLPQRLLGRACSMTGWDIIHMCLYISSAHLRVFLSLIDTSVLSIHPPKKSSIWAYIHQHVILLIRFPLWVEPMVQLEGAPCCNQKLACLSHVTQKESKERKKK